MKKQILLIEPYFTGSHKEWAEGYQRHSRHTIAFFSLSGHYWKWRMHGGAVTLSRKFLESDIKPDIILATDMLDLTTFLALTRGCTSTIPVALYFHENQLTYPWSPTDRDVSAKRDSHYSFINYASALSADIIFFNSCYHRKSFIEALSPFLKNFPDNNELNSIRKIEEKSKVLPLGMDLAALDRYKDNTIQKRERPLILWNHRWEYDKNPTMFFEALYTLLDSGRDFDVVLLGEHFRKKPVEFEQAKNRLGERILQYGYEKDFGAYARWLWRADIIPVTSNHDFFGASVVQAIYCDCYPLLPETLSYPEHIPTRYVRNYYYSFDELVASLAWAVDHINEVRRSSFRHCVDRYDWKKMSLYYDDTIESI